VRPWRVVSVVHKAAHSSEHLEPNRDIREGCSCGLPPSLNRRWPLCRAPQGARLRLHLPRQRVGGHDLWNGEAVDGHLLFRRRVVPWYDSPRAHMAEKSSIEWTDATWNPVTGCTKISAGCDNCYAERFSERFRGVAGHPFENGFDLTLRPERLAQPLHWRAPRMIFVNSMSELFHKDVPDAFKDRVFDTMERANWHEYQVLTKRSSLMMKYLKRRYRTAPGPPHIWYGVSVEAGTQLSRVRHLQQSPAGVRFLSIEPLIGNVGILPLAGIDWIIVGGESGRARVTWTRRGCARSGISARPLAWRFSSSNGAGSGPRRAGANLMEGRGTTFPKAAE
jgi:protein gp37